MDQKYDVIIIGAGPAGTITAKKCREKGLSVLVLEKRPEIGSPKRCAEGIMHDDLKRLGYTGKESFVAQRIDAGIIYSPGGKSVEIHGSAFGYVLERKVFDKTLAYEASKHGAKIYTKAEVFDLIKSDGIISGVRVIYNGEQKNIHGRIIVSAEGVESKISQLAGLKAGNTPKSVDSGYQYEMAGIKINPHMTCFYFGNEIAPHGYIWIFPKGEHIANVGIAVGGSSSKTAKYYLDRWIDSKPEIKKGSIIEENSGGIPIGAFMESMTLDNFLAIGDAAHQVNPLHGGGLAESSHAAQIAADVIVDAIKSNDTSNEKLDRYNKQWWEKRGKALKNVEKVVTVIRKFSDTDLDMIVSSFKWDDLSDIVDGKIHKLLKVLVKNPRLATLVKHLK